MNSNSGYMSEHQLELRKAVEQQLDLILKMQDERKALKKQNKLLNQQLKNTSQLMQKYRVDTAQFATNTEQAKPSEQQQQQQQQQTEDKQLQQAPKQEQIKTKVEYKDQYIQVEFENSSGGALNCSKLTQAQSLLKALDTTQQPIMPEKLDKKYIEEQLGNKPQKKVQNNSKQITNQIVKMTKEISTLKRQLKQSLQKQTQKDKQIRQIKKCLETKNQALEKSRKDFNELSILMNTDKFKSVRQLEQEITNLKAKLSKSQDSAKLKKILEGVTTEYDEYRQEMEKKWDILIEELANKQRENQMLKEDNKKMSKKLEDFCENHYDD